MPTLLLLHISAGAVGLLSGTVALAFRKGTPRHERAGKVFIAAMLSLSASGVYLALMKNQTSNVLGGILTFYLVATAWATARHDDGRSGFFDWGALLFALAAGIGMVTFGVDAASSPKGIKAGIPAANYFVLGSVVLLAATGDLRMLARGGIFGSRRIARHLWRMCFALFIAAASVFLARPQVFPPFLRKTSLPLILTGFPLIVMAFWLFRVRFSSFFRTTLMPRIKPSRVIAITADTE